MLAYLLDRMCRVLWLFCIVIFVGCSQPETLQQFDTNSSLDSLNEQAHSYLKIDLDTANLLSHNVLDLATQANDRLNIAKAKMTIGRVNYEKGICDSAILLFRDALKIGNDLNDTFLIAKAYNSIGTAYMCNGDYATAILYSDSAFHIYESILKFDNMGKAATDIAVCYIQLKSYDSAKRWFATSIYHAQKTTNTGFLVTLYNNYGLFNRDFGSKDTGSLYLNKAIDLARASELHVSLATVYLNYGQNLQNENPQLCKAYLDSALQLSLRYELYDLEEIVLGAKAICLRDLGMPLDIVGDAYELYVKQVKANQKLVNSQSFAEFEVKYNMSETEAENLRLMNQVHVKESGQRLIIFISLLLGLISMFIIWSLFQSRKLAIRDKKIYQQKVDALLKSQEIQNIDTMLEIQADERTRIATELHDRLGSILSAIKLNFSSIKEHLDHQDDATKARFGVLKRLIDEAATEVRKISHDMASGVLAKFGLMHAVDHLKKAIEASGNIVVNLFPHGMDERLSGTQEIILYRILQELISNSLKHGNADVIDVHLIHEGGKVSLIVEDNGTGFEENDRNRSDGMGLPNIRKRIQSVGGSFNIDSNHKSGTTVILELPIIV
ncbi:MAG: two-component system NarL family sensor kinase [Bacteroidia bacterium]